MPKNTTKNTPKQLSFIDTSHNATITGFHTFYFVGSPIRAILDSDNNPLFIANDVCIALNHTNIRVALQALPDDEKGVSKVYTLGGMQNMNVVTESGLYRLIFRSNKKEAEDFRRWVLHEVLPSIRKTGEYAYKSKTERNLESKVALHEKWGLGDRPEVQALKAELENKTGHALLKAVISILCKKPNWGSLNNLIYTALFGMVADELKTLFGTTAVRSKLPLRQLQMLTLAEGLLTDHLKVQNREITMETISSLIDIIIVPLGEIMRNHYEQLGLHPITGLPMLKANNNE